MRKRWQEGNKMNEYMPSIIIYGIVLIMNIIFLNERGMLIFSGILVGVINCILIEYIKQESKSK